jgi:hypothetical protein
MTTASQPPSRDWIATYDPDDPELQAAISRRRVRFRWMIGPIVLAYIVTREVLEASLGDDQSTNDVPGWLVLPLTVTFLVAAVLVVAGIAMALRPAARAAARRNPLPVLDRAQRRRVGQQLAGRVPVAPQEVPFLRDVALGTYAQRWAVAILAGLTLLCVGRFFADGSVDGEVVAGVAGLALAGLGAYGLRSVVRARRFLKSVAVAPA